MPGNNFDFFESKLIEEALDETGEEATDDELAPVSDLIVSAALTEIKFKKERITTRTEKLVFFTKAHLLTLN